MKIEDRLRKAYKLERRLEVTLKEAKLEPKEVVEPIMIGPTGTLAGGIIATVGGIAALGPFRVALLPVGGYLGMLFDSERVISSARKEAEELISAMGAEEVAYADKLRYDSIEGFLTDEIKGGCCDRGIARTRFDEVYSYAMLEPREERWSRNRWESWIELRDPRVALEIPKKIWTGLKKDPSKVVEAYVRLERYLHSYCDESRKSRTHSNDRISAKVLWAVERLVDKPGSVEEREMLRKAVRYISESELSSKDMGRYVGLGCKLGTR